MPRKSNAATLKHARYAERLLQYVARKYMMSLQTLRGEERFPHIVQARREFIQLADSKGIGSTTIAKVLWRNQDTVRYHLDPAKRAVRRNRYLAKRAAIEASP
jgi:hypothetical protein